MTGAHAVSGAKAESGPSSALVLPTASGRLERYQLGAARSFTKPTAPITSRTLYAAAHVVADPLTSGMGTANVDWDATIAYRRHLWSWGLGVADAMDTAQRGMGLDYAATKELISRSAREAKAVGGALVCGAATDQLPAGERVTLDQIVRAYLEQCAHIEREGAQVVLMCSRHLAAAATGPADYRTVYDQVLAEPSHAQPGTEHAPPTVTIAKLVRRMVDSMLANVLFRRLARGR